MKRILTLRCLMASYSPCPVSILQKWESAKTNSLRIWVKNSACQSSKNNLKNLLIQFLCVSRKRKKSRKSRVLKMIVRTYLDRQWLKPLSLKSKDKELGLFAIPMELMNQKCLTLSAIISSKSEYIYHLSVFICF